MIFSIGIVIKRITNNTIITNSNHRDDEDCIVTGLPVGVSIRSRLLQNKTTTTPYLTFTHASQTLHPFRACNIHPYTNAHC